MTPIPPTGNAVRNLLYSSRFPIRTTGKKPSHNVTPLITSCSDNVMNQRLRALARNRALAELGKRYRQEYQRLYREELSKLGGEESPPPPRTPPAVSERSVKDTSEPPAEAVHRHQRNRVGIGGIWFCSCGALSRDLGATWRTP